VANVANFQNTCKGKPQIICLSWTSSFANKFIVTITSPAHTFTYGGDVRKVNLVDLDASTSYTVTIVAVDGSGIQSTKLSITETTGSDTPKSNPKGKGPLPNSLSCSQLSGTASVSASWTLQSVIPSRVLLQVKCPFVRARKITITPPSKTKVTVAGLFGKTAASRTLNCSCKLRAFYKKPESANRQYPIPLLKAKFTLDTSAI